jgi:mannan endo-1,4-beta-mannosidase
VSNCEQSFFTDPALITDYENHMRAVLDHVNPYTGLAYKDDPTFAGWADGNVLGAQGTTTSVLESWIHSVSDYFRTVDHHQLFVDISAASGSLTLGTIDPGALKIPGVDVYGMEYYPVVCILTGDPARCDPKLVHQAAAQAAAAGKTFAPMEFGWDKTNFTTAPGLQQFLTGLEADPDIAGDNFWELVSHADGHGWQPIPADAAHCPPATTCHDNGNWWALYYTGIDTTSNTATDMAERAQLLRTHGYRMAGQATPAHRPVPAPAITSIAGGTVLFRGSAGSPSYTIQKRTGGAWTTACDNCVTDASPAWHDPDATAPGSYRVIGHNLDGVEGPASPPAGNHG